MICQIFLGPTGRWHIHAWHEHGSFQGGPAGHEEYEYHGSNHEAKASSYDIDEAASDIKVDISEWDCQSIDGSSRRACLHEALEEALASKNTCDPSYSRYLMARCSLQFRDRQGE